MESLIPTACILFLIIYSGMLSFAVPKALNVGSQTYFVSIIHRWTGILTLLLPIPLMAYEAIYEMHPNVHIYLFTVITIAFNCIFGGLLIPKRIPKWDIPTIRAFVEYPFTICFLILHRFDPLNYEHLKAVSVVAGLSWIALSLIMRFGHFSLFEPFGRFLVVLNIISTAYALIDIITHLHQFLINMKAGTAMDFGFKCRSKKPSDVGFKDESPSLWYCFVTAFLAIGFQTALGRANMKMVTETPSNLPVIVISGIIAVFGMSGCCLAWQYLIHGQEGMVHLQKTFPRASQMAVCGTLGVALANNFGVFTGSLVE